MKKVLLIFTLFILGLSQIISCKKEESKPPVIPEILMNDASVAEGNTGVKKAIIAIDLSEETTAEVRLKWSTEDGSAKAGEDYEAVAGKELVFTPGLLYQTIQVDINSDSYLELHESFYIQISNLVNASANRTSLKVTIMNDDSYTAEKVSDGYITPINYPGMTLIWSDEFNGNSLNTSDWNYETGGGGWGNNELEVYTNSPANSYLQDGFLHIKATKNPYTGEYNSARLTTKGKQEFTYGRIDIRARMPIGQGIWPALWMLGGNISSVGWPKCGEIDIMEYIGHDPLTVHGTVHYYDGTHKYRGKDFSVNQAENFHETFHVFTIIWQENSIEWYVDYRKYYTASPSTIKYEAFRLPQFFIVNLAVGGIWPGYPDETTVFPQILQVDYIRVFQ